MSAFCAICTAEIAGTNKIVRRAPLGKDGALVAICAACDSEVPDANAGPKRSAYTGGAGPAMSVKEVTAGGVRAMGQAEWSRRTSIDVKNGITPSAPATEAERALSEYDHESVHRIRTKANQKKTPRHKRWNPRS